jgi:uncharacterized membrane protein
MAIQADVDPIPSKAAIAGHPIHPILIPFPVAFLALVVVTDLVFAAGKGPFWALASYYLIWAGVVTGGVAAVFGMIDFVAIRRVRERRAGWIHLGANLTLIALAVINGIVRMDDLTAHIVPAALTLSIATAVVLGISGWYGGELAYRHKIGVAAAPSREAAQRPVPVTPYTSPRGGVGA